VSARYNAKTDIFSLGIVFCELACFAIPGQLGILPWLGSDMLANPEAMARWRARPQRMRDFVLALLAQVWNGFPGSTHTIHHIVVGAQRSADG
jgi:hypothetical protein